MTGRFRPIGLRGKLAISIAGIVLVALGVTFFAAYRGTESDLRSGVDADLEREVDGLARNLSSGPPLPPAGLKARADRLILSQPFGPSSRIIAITLPGAGTATSQPELLGRGRPPGEGRPGSGDDAGEEGEEHEEGSRDGDRESARKLLGSGPGYSTIPIEDVGKVRLLTREVGTPGGSEATIRVGQPLEPVERALDGLSDTFLAVGLVSLVLAALAGWLLASRSTGPMRKIAEVAELVGSGELSTRMPIEETRNDEVRRLAESFNEMLDRLEGAFARQREFVGDASHDLRTPLTIIRGQIEVLARKPDPDPGEIARVAAQTGAATDRMERLVDDLLLLARADSDDVLRTSLSPVGPLLTAELDGFRDTNDRHFEIDDRSTREVPLDRDQMARAVSNLLANAIAHTGDGGTVAILAEDTPNGVRIAVDDDGPGIPPAERDAVFDRFKRLDQSRASDRGGSGLGLAIVKAITESHNGRVSCEQSPLGGARFSIHLPAAAREAPENRHG